MDRPVLRLVLIALSPLAWVAMVLPAQQPAAAAAPVASSNVPSNPLQTPNPVPPAPVNDVLLSQPPSELIGDLLNVRGRYLAAIHVYEQLPPTVPVQNKLGIAALHMRMYDRSRQAFETALKLDPRSPEVYNNLGTLAHSQGDTRRAEKMYQKSLKLRPDSANTLQNLGTLYYAEGKFKKGSDCYAKAIKIDPGIMERSHDGIETNAKTSTASEVHYRLAMSYAQAHSNKMALEYLRKAIGEGFHDRNRLMHEKEFADLRTSEAFLQMVDDLKKD